MKNLRRVCAAQHTSRTPAGYSLWTELDFGSHLMSLDVFLLRIIYSVELECDGLFDF